MPLRLAAVDLGATSGRVMVGTVGPGVLALEEVHRFPNGPVRHDDGSLRWDIRRIYREVLAGLRCGRRAVDAIGIDGWAVDYGLLDAAGELLGDPFCYRDDRTDAVRGQVLSRVGPEELYATPACSSCRSTRSTSSRPRPPCGSRHDAPGPGPARLLAHR